MGGWVMHFNVPGCRPEPPDRITARQLHLTYAGLWPNEKDFGTLLLAARGWGATRGGLREYVIGREKHANPNVAGRDEHFHLYSHFANKVDLSNRRTTTIFDLVGRGGRTLHPEIQSVGLTAADRERPDELYECECSLLKVVR